MSTISTARDHALLLEKALSSLASELDAGGLDFAALQSMMELGWSYPLSNDKKVFWAI